MKKLIEIINTIVPFINSYPPWVKVLFVVWLCSVAILSVIVLTILIFAYPKPSTRVALQPREKICMITIDNPGEVTDKNIIVKINFTPSNSISSVNYNRETVILLRGGKSGSGFADFKIKELSPTQQEDIKIFLVNEIKENPSIEAWSEGKKHIRKIPIITLKFGPEENYPGD